MASATVAINAKAEGDLVISGSKGYIYVPAPWWKTEFFELRFEDVNLNQNTSISLKVKAYDMKSLSS